MSPTIQVHAVVLAGNKLGLTELRRELDEFTCNHYRDNAMLVADVAADELPLLEKLADTYGARVEQVRETRQVRIAEDEADQPSQPKLDVLSGGWYRTNQDEFPLLNIISMRNEVDPDGIMLWLFDVDLVGPSALPQQATMSAEQLAKYKPKPASLDDFEKLDIAPPAYFEPTPHAIPSVDDDMEDWSDAKEEQLKEAASIPKAQLAAQALRKQLGVNLISSEIAKHQDGYIVKANVRRGMSDLPTTSAGVSVRYIRK